jgi:hypothetical protein
MQISLLVVTVICVHMHFFFAFYYISIFSIHFGDLFLTTFSLSMEEFSLCAGSARRGLSTNVNMKGFTFKHARIYTQTPPCTAVCVSHDSRRDVALVRCLLMLLTAEDG